MCGELIHILQGHDHKGYQAFLGMTAAPMDVRQWADRDDASGENTVVPPETYVKVAGHLRSFQVKSEKKQEQLKCICMKQFLESCLHLGYLRLN